MCGANPRLRIDTNYQSFFEVAAGHVANAMAAARAYEQERQRAEALAELDRTKTAFFSNVSHEFRTPLTLLLGPLEEILNKADSDLVPDNRALVDVAHRNGLRLLRLVNALLDFSRIEAGRTNAVYRRTDLASFTAELASGFRSISEKAGLGFTVEAPPLSKAIYVDPAMWEKIVLNLLSNAFKFTFEGEIRVALTETPEGARLTVRDTGIGIDSEELPKLFDRFHRVEGAKGRSFEGSGIGLALVEELAELHGGEVSAESEPGKGSAFHVTIPFGRDHLPAEQIADGEGRPSIAGSAPFIEEASRWLPEHPHRATANDDLRRSDGRPRIVLADDNADMRNYIQRLLADDYIVEAVGDGEAALGAIRREPPDLILTDVMMPKLDGFRAGESDPRRRIARRPSGRDAVRAGRRGSGDQRTGGGGR